jgi:hypothetical protein
MRRLPTERWLASSKGLSPLSTLRNPRSCIWNSRHEHLGCRLVPAVGSDEAMRVTFGCLNTNSYNFGTTTQLRTPTRLRWGQSSLHVWIESGGTEHLILLNVSW